MHSFATIGGVRAPRPRDRTPLGARTIIGITYGIITMKIFQDVLVAVGGDLVPTIHQTLD